MKGHGVHCMIIVPVQLIWLSSLNFGQENELDSFHFFFNIRRGWMVYMSGFGDESHITEPHIKKSRVKVMMTHDSLMLWQNTRVIRMSANNSRHIAYRALCVYIPLCLC